MAHKVGLCGSRSPQDKIRHDSHGGVAEDLDFQVARLELVVLKNVFANLRDFVRLGADFSAHVRLDVGRCITISR